MRSMLQSGAQKLNSPRNKQLYLMKITTQTTRIQIWSYGC